MLHLPASIIVIIITPTSALPLQLTVPAHCFRGEGVHIDRWCLNAASSGGTGTQSFLRAAYLGCGEGLGRLGEETLKDGKVQNK